MSDTHPPAVEPIGWWRDAAIYQVYPRSFADSNGDGVGDLAGITSRLEHLRDLGVDAVWLSPFYRSPQVDLGYDVEDYCDVDPDYGTVGDAELLIERAHQLGLRVIIDIVPNHCSSAHVRFQAALAAARGSQERDWFIFRDGRGDDGSLPPNNWGGTDNGSAWTRVTDDGRPGQWYLHIFDAAQPDWNWENPAVADMFDDVLRFWLDRGADGFRVDVAHGMIKAEGLPDAHPRPPSPVIPTVDPATRPPMWDQDGVHDIYRRWRRVLDEYDDRILVAEAWLQPQRGKLYVRPDEMHQSFNFHYLVTPWRAADLRETIDVSLASDRSVGAPTTWVLSNHDTIRHVSRLSFPPGSSLEQGRHRGDPRPGDEPGRRRARAATALMLSLPGSAYIYQGEELGLPQVFDIPADAITDYYWATSGHEDYGRDGCRVPIPWEPGAASYGFGPSKNSWLPQPAWFAEYSIAAQVGVPGSSLEFYRTALRIRRERALGHGHLEWLDSPDDVLLVGRPDSVIVANTGSLPVLVQLPPGAALLLDSASELASGTPLGSEVEIPGDTTWWVAVDEGAVR